MTADGPNPDWVAARLRADDIDLGAADLDALVPLARAVQADAAHLGALPAAAMQWSGHAVGPAHPAPVPPFTPGEGQPDSEAQLTVLLQRADVIDADLGAYLARFDTTALAAARRADEERAHGHVRGPLHGVAVALKDIIASVEAPTTAQSNVTPVLPSGVDAPIVQRLRAAGAVIIGKTSLNEFACGPPSPDAGYPLPRNPWDRDRWAGGSSSGSAAGVGAGLFPMAVGTDTGGSIRIPSAYCGVTGFKPTFGLVPTDGVVAFAYSADTVGPIARSAADCAVLLSVLADRDDIAAAVADADHVLEHARIGADRHYREVSGVDPALGVRFEDALGELAALGAQVDDVDIRAASEAAVLSSQVMSAVEAYEFHRPHLRAEWSAYLPGTRGSLVMGAFHRVADYVRAQRVRAAATAELLERFGAVDFVVSPTVGAAAPTFDTDFYALLPLFFTRVWNGAGFPALSLPMGRNRDGLPLGLQIVGAPGTDRAVLAAGIAFQRRTAFHTELPPHPAPPRPTRRTGE
jgi:aspartyl-tRNA(Asn)/glutamyl-tRNA(Gln) amidotransferase subunit A